MAQNKHISIGRVGEDIVSGYLQNRGYTIRERNYRKKCGEIDIVAYKDSVLHVVEVKSASWSGTWPAEHGGERYRPEDHMHAHKRARLINVTQVYLMEHPLRHGEEVTVDLAVVYINDAERRAHVHMLWNIILD